MEKRSSVPVDVSLTLRVNVTGDYRHSGVRICYGKKKPVETSPGVGKGEEYKEKYHLVDHLSKQINC